LTYHRDWYTVAPSYSFVGDQRKRDLIREGFAADLTLFDPETIAPLPPGPAYDLPGTGDMRVKQESSGIDYVIVNGRILLEDGMHTGALPGQVLTHGGHALNQENGNDP
jgi:N-acyl-D-aspartate/D-glutamate deacylase